HANHKKVNSRLVAPTILKNEPCGEHVEGLSLGVNGSCRLKFAFNRLRPLALHFQAAWHKLLRHVTVGSPNPVARDEPLLVLLLFMRSARSSQTRRWDRGAMSEFKIAAAQFASVRGDLAGNILTHAAAIAAAADQRVSVLVFPELSLIGYEPDLAA